MQNIRRQLLTIVAFLPLLVGCAGGAGQLQDWISDLIAGPAPTVQAPPTPGLAPTPTLVSDAGLPPAATPEQPGSPPQDTPAPQETPVLEEFGPFTGTFVGAMTGDDSSSAPLALALVQSGNHIAGTATLEEGLVVRAGVCGSFPIPAITLNIDEELEEAGERRLSTTANVAVGGFEIPVQLEATMDPDGDTVTAQATMYPPSLCGTDPTVSATLTRVSDNGS